MLIFGDRAKPVYEVKINSLNILTKKYERCFDYVHAENEEEAKRIIAWVYGQHTEVLSVNIDE